MSLTYILVLFMILFYYWIIHPILLIILNKIIVRQKIKNENIKDKFYNWPVVMIIPTFGKRRVIIKKIKLLNNFFKNNKFNFIIKKIIIIYSNPDKNILLRLIKAMKECCPSKYVLVLESERGGKAKAINEAIWLADKEINNKKDYIVMVSDDDTLFEEEAVKKALQEFSKNPILGLVSVAPRYPASINLLYKIKRIIHRLEEKICAPATIYGDFLVFRRGIIDYIDEDTLAEDFQLNLKTLIKGFKTKLIDGSVYERYPLSFKGIVSRSRRTIVGTFMEYSRFIRHLLDKRLFRCVYIYTSYLLSVLMIPLGIIYVLLIAIYILKNILFAKLIIIVFLIMISLIYYLNKQYILLNLINFVFALLVGGLLSYIEIVKIILNKTKIDINKLWENVK